MNDPRSISAIDDDLVMAVIDGNETLIARLQQERSSITDRARNSMNDLDIL